MFDFDGDEWFFFGAAALVAVVGMVRYYRPVVSVLVGRGSALRRVVVGGLPLVALAPTVVVLLRYADPQVVGHFDYTLLFLLGGGAWVFSAAWMLGIMGISVRDDAIERDNAAALAAACGIILGVGVVYAGANIGSGPTIWTTILPAAAATILLGAMVLLMEWAGGDVADAIVIGRDGASGWRMAGAMLGCAIILGWAAAGDWVSWEQTWWDLARRGWPAVVLAAAAGLVHRRLRPTADRPLPGTLAAGLAPAQIFVAAGILVDLIGR